MKLSFNSIFFYLQKFESNDILDDPLCDTQTFKKKFNYKLPTPSCLVKRLRQSLKATHVSLEASETTSTFWRNDGSISINKKKKKSEMSGTLGNLKVN